LTGNLQRGGAGVKNDGFAVVDERGGHGANAPFFLRMRLQPFVYRRFAQDGIRQHGAAMRTVYQAALVEGVQIVANRDRGGIEMSGKLIDANPPVLRTIWRI